MVSHHPAKFSGHMHCSSRDITTKTCCSLLKIICYHFSYETAKANYFKGDFYIDL